MEAITEELNLIIALITKIIQGPFATATTLVWVVPQGECGPWLNGPFLSKHTIILMWGREIILCEKAHPELTDHLMISSYHYQHSRENMC